jgi:GTP pyrophosphokinase
LGNGDIVEILTSKSSPGPSKDWLGFVKTSSAKSRIKQWYKREQREENIIKGEDTLENELRKRHLNAKDLMKDDKMQDIRGRFGYATVDDLYVSLGEGGITVNQIINKLKELYFKDKPVEDILTHTNTVPTLPHRDRETGAVRVKGVEDVAVRLAHCCNPLPGDNILGYITRGRGVSVHRKDCPNMVNYLKNEKDRLLEVEWVDDIGIYTVELEVRAIDRPRLTTDVMDVIADVRIHINSVFSRVTKNNQAVMNLKIEIKDLTKLQAVMERIQKVKDVLEIRRVLPGEIRSDG